MTSQPYLPADIMDLIIAHIHDDRSFESISLVSKQFLSFSNLHKYTLKISNPPPTSLLSILHRFPRLSHFSFSSFLGDASPVLLQIAAFPFRLQSLDLSGQSILPVEALFQFPPSVRRGVKSLNLSSLRRGDLELIPDLFPNLEDMDLSRHNSRHYISKYGICLLVSKLNCLRRISMPGNDLVSDLLLFSLSMSSPDLEEITLRESKDVTITGIEFILYSCRRLRTIRLLGKNADCNSTNRHVFGNSRWLSGSIGQTLSSAPSLSEIDVRYIHLSSAVLGHITQACLPFLTRLTLSHCFSRIDAISLLLKTYDSLDYLDLEGIGLSSDESMADNAKYLSKATVVKLNYCESISNLTLFALVSHCPLLHTVEMEHASVGIRIKEGYSNAVNPQIRTLKLSFNKHLSDKCLRQIALACPNLETLHLNFCGGISRVGVANFFGKGSRLKHLEINGCLGVRFLYGGCRMTHKLEFLKASESGLTDKALISISENCPLLRFLDLKNCTGFGSVGVKQIVDKCTELKEINLHGCNDMSHILDRMVLSKPNLRKIVPSELVQPDYKGRSEGRCHVV